MSDAARRGERESHVDMSLVRVLMCSNATVGETVGGATLRATLGHHRKAKGVLKGSAARALCIVHRNILSVLLSITASWSGRPGAKHARETAFPFV